MGGTVLFQDALKDRLNLIKPSRADFNECLEQHPLQFTPGIVAFIDRLHARGSAVYLVSGGMREVFLSKDEHKHSSMSKDLTNYSFR